MERQRQQVPTVVFLLAVFAGACLATQTTIAKKRFVFDGNRPYLTAAGVTTSAACLALATDTVFAIWNGKCLAGSVSNISYVVDTGIADTTVDMKINDLWVKTETGAVLPDKIKCLRATVGVPAVCTGLGYQATNGTHCCDHWEIGTEQWNIWYSATYQRKAAGASFDLPRIKTGLSTKRLTTIVRTRTPGLEDPENQFGVAIETETAPGCIAPLYTCMEGCVPDGESLTWRVPTDGFAPMPTVECVMNFTMTSSGTEAHWISTTTHGIDCHPMAFPVGTGGVGGTWTHWSLNGARFWEHQDCVAKGNPAGNRIAGVMATYNGELYGSFMFGSRASFGLEPKSASYPMRMLDAKVVLTEGSGWTRRGYVPWDARADMGTPYGAVMNGKRYTKDIKVGERETTHVGKVLEKRIADPRSCGGRARAMCIGDLFTESWVFHTCKFQPDPAPTAWWITGCHDLFECSKPNSIIDSCSCTAGCVCYREDDIVHHLCADGKVPTAGTYLEERKVKVWTMFGFKKIGQIPIGPRNSGMFVWTEFGGLEQEWQSPLMQASVISNNEGRDYIYYGFQHWAEGLTQMEIIDGELYGTGDKGVAKVLSKYRKVGNFTLSTAEYGELITPAKSDRGLKLGYDYRKYDSCLEDWNGAGKMSAFGRWNCRYGDIQAGWFLTGIIIGSLVAATWVYDMITAGLWMCGFIPWLHEMKRIRQMGITFGNIMPDIRKRKYLDHEVLTKDGNTKFGGHKVIHQNYIIMNEIRKQQGGWYAIVDRVSAWMRPVWYCLILSGQAMNIAASPITFLYYMLTKEKPSKTRETREDAKTHYKHRVLLCYLTMFSMVYRMPCTHAALDFRVLHNLPETRGIGTSISYNEKCTGDQCTASFYQNYPIPMQPGASVESKIYDGSDKLVGALKVELVETGTYGLGLYDHSIWTVDAPSVTTWLDRNDDCDSDGIWNCNENQNPYCLLYKNELALGDGPTEGSQDPYIDVHYSMAVPWNVVVGCPKGIFWKTIASDGQRNYIRWMPQASKKPVVRVFTVPRVTSQIKMKVSMTLLSEVVEEEFNLDFIGSSHDIGDFTTASIVQWNEEWNLGERIGCIFETSDARTATACYGGFQGFSATDIFLKADGEMWGPDCPIGGCGPNNWKYTGFKGSFSADNSKWGASISDDGLLSWSQNDISALGKVLETSSGCSYKVSVIDGTSTMNTTTKFVTGHSETYTYELYRPEQIKLDLVSCPQKKLEASIVVTDFPYRVESPEIAIIDPRTLTVTTRGCFGFANLAETTFSKTEDSAEGIVLLKNAADLICSSAFWMNTATHIENCTAYNSAFTSIVAYDADRAEVTVPVNKQEFTLCEKYSDPGDNGEGNPPPGEELPWWVWLVVAVCSAMVLGVVIWALCVACKRNKAKGVTVINSEPVKKEESPGAVKSMFEDLLSKGKKMVDLKKEEKMTKEA